MRQREDLLLCKAKRHLRMALEHALPRSDIANEDSGESSAASEGKVRIPELELQSTLRLRYQTSNMESALAHGVGLGDNEYLCRREGEE
jgi:hypothetical protein